LLAELPAGSIVNITRAAMSYAPGSERTNARTGEIQQFADGRWILPTDGQPANSTAGAVTAESCSIQTQEILSAAQIQFAKSSSEIAESSQITLDQLSGEIIQCFRNAPSLSIEVGGYTDSRGSNDYNQRLSEARAAAVREALIIRGLSADRVTSRGYGEADPIASNDTAEGRAQNRRTAIKWLE
jgi:OOP family OmpA-OmpF porin